MHWGIDAQRLSGQRLGVGRYIEQLVGHWADMKRASDRLTLFVRERGAASDLPFPSGFSVSAPGPKLSGQLWQNLVLPRHTGDLDVLFCPSYTAPLRYRGRCVVAIHSTNEIMAGTHSWLHQQTYARLYRMSARRADRVIVPSESTKQDIQVLYGIPASKIDVVPQGANADFRPLDDPELMRATRVRYLGEDVPYVVFVGKLSLRRNIPVLLEAFAQLKRTTALPHKLLLMGPNSSDVPLARLTTELGLTDSVIQTDGRVASHRELVPVYNAADLYVNASSYEGFSMTLVEAIACGTPVVGVNRAAVGEIAGECGLMVAEPDRDLLAGAMERALTDRALHAELRRKGLERANDFRWENTARLTLDVLRRVGEAA
ncbi:MAG: glycosyltransferase family 4 protein [Gemmatimonadaceae bacterium]